MTDHHHDDELYRWAEPPELPAEAFTLHADPIVSRLLFDRGLRSLEEANAFMDPSPQAAPDPFVLLNMDRAVGRIAEALKRGQHIGVYGDYDADGVTSTAILSTAFEWIGGPSAKVTKRLPLREEGYGLHVHAVDDLADAGVEVLVVADCGSSDHESVAHAISRGMDVVIIDHHQMLDGGPDEAVVVSAYAADALPYREMSAAGLSYLLVVGLARSGLLPDDNWEERFMALGDLAAVGTVADVSPITGANRALVRDGIRQIRRSSRAGLVAMCVHANRNPLHINSGDLAFQLGPRLNAAGRIDDPHIALELMLTDDREEAEQMATVIEDLNLRRRAETARIAREVSRREDVLRGPVIVASSQEWAPGIVGNAASRLVEAYGKPVVLFAENDGIATGSARSVDGLNIVDALRARPELLLRCGGHTQAAGITIASKNIPLLRDSLDAVAGPILEAREPSPHLVFDAVIDPDYLTMENARKISAIGPFGEGNPQPLFLLRDVPIRQTQIMGKDRSHLRIHFDGPQGPIRAPYFSAAERYHEISSLVRGDLALTLSVGFWNGLRLEVQVQDVRPVG